jgi:predicted ATPase
VEYIFKHALTQEVVYSGLVKSKRRQIHERVGRVLEYLFEGRISEYYEALGYHFQRGRSLDKAGDCFTESVAYFRLCGSDTLSEQVETEQVALTENPTNKQEKKGA